ncbi:hypothetical protein BCR44DRAFT_1434994 [Catenaria anguillulae PL171]|uniref:Ankyrin repeat-containing domain protein n=1 Tax=Catenaria anguillulae PL171 TaxID=765915 RepID=A0A1Y2HM59_9FUNG|nr:hypothetical protein BCR44DRAFT_1434994 [Catenaria anguillulae PL171]
MNIQCSTMTNSSSSSQPVTPSLTFDLAELVTVYVYRLQAVATLWEDAHALAQPLNVLSRTLMPLLTKAALVQMPHVDMDFASTKLANVELLEFMYAWWRNSGKDPRARPMQFRSGHHKGVGAIDVASENGSVDVLKWWLSKPDLFFLWTHVALDRASANGELSLLKWWFFESGVPRTELRFTVDAMDLASEMGHNHVLQWWMAESGLSEIELLYTEDAMALAAANGHLSTLEWWLQSGLPVKARDVLDAAASKDRMDILEWCLQQPIIMAQAKCGIGSVDDVVTGAIKRKNYALLFWFDTHIPLTAVATAKWDEHQTDGFNLASKEGRIDVLEWLLKHGYSPLTEGYYYSMASMSGNVDMLDFWFNYEGEFDRDETFDAFLSTNEIHVLDWWVKSGLMTPSELEDSDSFIGFLREYGASGNLEMIRWWVEIAGADYSFLLPSAIEGASAAGQFEILNYYLSHCKPLESEFVSYCIKWQATTDAEFVSAFTTLDGGHRHDPKSLLWWTQVFHLDGAMLASSYQHWEPQLMDPLLSTFIANSHGLMPAINQAEMAELVPLCCSSGLLSELMYFHRHLVLPVLRWWRHEGLELVIPQYDDFVRFYVAVREWWKSTGLLPQGYE